MDLIGEPAPNVRQLLAFYLEAGVDCALAEEPVDRLSEPEVPTAPAPVRETAPPRLFQDAQSIPGLTWPTLTFEGQMSIYLGKREVRLMQLGAGHTSGDIVAWVPDAEVMFSGDLIEYHSACYCGDAHLREWPETLNEIRSFNPKAIAPGRGDALKGLATGRDAIAMTRDFVTTLYGAAESAVAKGRNLKETMAAARDVMDPKFSSFAIYEHCLPFNVSRAFDEASGIDDPVIWTAERDREMWAALQGG